MSVVESAPRAIGLMLRLMVLLVTACLALVLHSATGHDDSHITYWAAHALAEFGEIVNYNGVRLEQSSSLLQTVLLAGLHRLTGAAIPALAFYVSIAAWALSIWRVDLLLRRSGVELGLAGFCVLASSPLLGYWSLGGLETSLYIWLLVEASWRLTLIARAQASVFSPVTVSVFAAVVLARPESPLVLISGTLAVAALAGIEGLSRDRAGWPRLGRALLATGLAGGLFALLVGWRSFYFGNAFPQSVTVKMGADDLWYRIQDGLANSIDMAVLADLPVLLLGWIATVVIYLFRRRDHDWRIVVPCLLIGIQFCFNVAVGGDWMFGARFWSHVLPLMYFCLFSMTSKWRDESASGKLGWRAAMTGLIVINLAGGLYSARYWNSSRPVWTAVNVDELLREQTAEFDFCWAERTNPVHLRDALFLAQINSTIEALTRRKEVVTIASGQAGMVMYYLARKYYGKIRFIDRHGLSTRWEPEELAQANGYVDKLGLSIPIERFLMLGRKFPRLAPDVVFDLGQQRAASTEAAGFKLIHEVLGTAVAWIEPTTLELKQERQQRVAERRRQIEERGYATPKRPAPRFFSQQFDLHQFLAVAPRLARELSLDHSVLNWDELRRQMQDRRD